MTAFAYHYRATIYGTDSVTALVPRSGAAHAEAFQVTSQPGVANWRDYIIGEPTGRRGTLDRLTGRYSIGEVTIRLLDKKVASDNLVRWITAFLGDAAGVNQFKGKRLKIEEYDGSAWTDFFVGRIHNVIAPDPGAEGPVFDFVIREEMTQAKRDTFVGCPHKDITYAQPSPLLPMGDGVAPFTGRLKGVIRTATMGTFIELTTNEFSASKKSGKNRMNKALATRADYRVTHANSAIREYCPHARVRIKRLDTNAEGDFYMASVDPVGSPKGAYDGAAISPVWLIDNWVQGIGITPIPNHASNTTHPYKYMALPPAGTQCEFYVYNAGPPTADAATLVGPVHPVTLWKDLLNGKFSTLNDQGSGKTGETLDGSVAVRAIPFDAATFTALEADATIPTLRFFIDKVWKLEDFLVEQIFKVRHIAGRTQGSGEVFAKDLRLSSTTSTGLATIGQADIIDGGWEQGADAVSSVSVKVYTERPVLALEANATDDIIAELPMHGIRERVEVVTFATPLMGDAAAQRLTIDPRGLKANSVFQENIRAWDLQNLARDVSRPYEQIFGTSAGYFSGTFRRTSNTNKWPGDFVLLDVNELPDAASNNRGGTRVMMVLERSEIGPNRRMRFIDMGPDSVAVVPVIGTPTVNATTPKHAIDLAVTLNASTEPAFVQVAITATSVAVRPAADSALWQTRGSKVTASTTITIDQLPSGKRVWVRAITETPDKLPSSYAHPAVTGYVDTTALTAPSAVAVTIANRSAIATWTNGEAKYPTMPTLASVDVRTAPLPAGSTRYVFDELAASTLFVFGVKHVDAYGGESAIATDTDTTGTAATLNPPRSLQILQGRGSTSRASFPPEELQIGFGFQVSVAASEPGAAIRVQLSQDNFASIEQAVDLEPGTDKAFLFTPSDNTLRYIRAMHVRDTFTTSAATSTAIAYPTALVSAAQSDAFAGGYAFLSIEPDGTIKLNVGSDDSDSDACYYEIARNSATYPTVDTSDTSIARASFHPTPYFATVTVGASNKIGSDELKLTLTFWNKVTGFGQVVTHSIRGPLVPPAILPRATFSANADTADVFATLTSATETIRLHVKLAEGGTTWSLCAGAADSTARFVASGTEIGPTDYFHDGATIVQVLNDIALTRDQIDRIYLQAESLSGLKSTWLPLALDMKGMPWLESVTLEFDDVLDRVLSTTRGGARVASVAVEFSDDSTFATIDNTSYSNLADGGSLLSAYTLAAADRDRVWYVRVTPYNGALVAGVPTGLAGMAQVAECYVTGNVSKKLKIAGDKFDPYTDAITFTKALEIQPAAGDTGAGNFYTGSVELPSGTSVTITGMRLRASRTASAAGNVAEVTLYRYNDDGTGTSIGVCTHAGTGYSTTGTTSFTETTAGRTYMLYAQLTQAAAQTSTLVFVELDYTMPDYQASV